MALQLGPISLYWYGICYAVGLAGAVPGHGPDGRAIPAEPGDPRRCRRRDRRARRGPAVPRHRPVAGALRRRPDQDLPPAICRSRDLRRVHHRGDRGHRAGPLQGLVLAVGGHRRPGHLRDAGRGRLGLLQQELYGPPTTLPWGVAIDCEHRIAVSVRDVPGRSDPLPAALPVRVAERAHRRAGLDLAREPAATVAADWRPRRDHVHLDRPGAVPGRVPPGSATGGSATSRPPSSSARRSC